MFTGIIECLGHVESVVREGANKRIKVASTISKDLRVDQSLSHDGICLTVVAHDGSTHSVVAVDETLSRSTIDLWVPGQSVNLERAMIAGDRLDGHIVQGHVDGKATCTAVKDVNGSIVLQFAIDTKFSPLLVDKGSVCLNGVSLTVIDPTDDHFEVAIIPYTWDHTNLSQITPGAQVNVEFDIVAKYLLRQIARYK